ncbi:anthrone oxygenase family protein [Amycolatopsis aidingensis]|uniref:anthrone oxygenase family protein n=1 Tax=Amycolatopsis aidingensis TaxID=2842453 RepID=UPI001C0B576A|nr:DUF1772 domain-containing protein [Amycolatopsis aidingensis]
MSTVLIPVVLLASGLAAGVLLATQLGGWPLLRGLPAADYVRAHAFFSTRYDPWMPICLVTTFLGDLVLALSTGNGVARVFFAAAALLAVCTGVISVLKNVPVNRWVRTLDPDSLPRDFHRIDPRTGWGSWNRRRSVLGILAFGLNCAGLGVLL